MSYLFTSESVSAGHPDKVADQISDAILDAHLSQDPNAKVACECLCTTNRVVVAGEVKSSAEVDVIAVVRRTIAEIGIRPTIGFDAESCEITNSYTNNRPTFVKGSSRRAGCRRPRYNVCYAVKETEQLIPATLALSNLLLRELDAIRTEGKVMTTYAPIPRAKSLSNIATMGNQSASTQSLSLPNTATAWQWSKWRGYYHSICSHELWRMRALPLYQESSIYLSIQQGDSLLVDLLEIRAHRP